MAWLTAPDVGRRARMRGQSSTTFGQCTTGLAWCATNVATTCQPHQTPSATMASRTVNPQEKETQWVRLIRVTACRRHPELISPNWESEQRGQGELNFPLAALLGTPPPHQHSPGREPDGEGTTCQPAMSHHLFSYTSWPGSCPLLWNHTRHLPAVLDFVNLRLKVKTLRVGRIKNQQC